MPPLLLAAARRLEPLDVSLARETYLDALTAALFTGRLAGTADTQQVAEAALAAPAASAPRAVDLLLDGLATLIVDGPVAGTPPVRKAVAAFARRDVEPTEALRWRWLAGRAAGFIWDYDGWDVLHRSPPSSGAGGWIARRVAACAQHARRRPPLGRRDEGGGGARRGGRCARAGHGRWHRASLCARWAWLPTEGMRTRR